MIPFIFLFTLNLCALEAVYIYDYEETTKPNYISVEDEFEPVVPQNINRQIHNTKNLDCDDFKTYALNCTLDAALIYNSTKKTPPMPDKIQSWCRAIRQLTNCALDWNSECKDFTETHFNEESVKGHMHVVNSVCDDDWFITRYNKLSQCLDSVSNSWEKCYTVFKNKVDSLKNTTQEWTHYNTHFQLCCARTLFRRCTLDAIFDNPVTKCEKEHALTVQKFSVIVSEGDVYQNCDNHILYSNCPGGDPRPPSTLIARLMGSEILDKPKENYNIKYVFYNQSTNSQNANYVKFILILYIILIFIFI